MKGTLFVVATPIGNLSDISLRAIEVLRSVDLIAAEDTRHSAKLMQHFNIQTPLTSYHEYSPERQTERLLYHLTQGQDLALISDAGTPLISDPGYRIVRACHLAAIRVAPLPGASSLTSALSVSGLPTDKFHFEGFLPAAAGKRERRLVSLKVIKTTIVFFESPHRLVDTLAAVEAHLGDRPATLCRELTKIFETVFHGAVSELRKLVTLDTNQRRGEIVLLIGGNTDDAFFLSDQNSTLLNRLAKELPPRRAASIVSDLTGLPTKELYELILEKERSD